jgi:hypothetical protein
MNNIMLDLETMGTSSNAAIIAIGACFFDPKTAVVGAEFYQTIDLEDAALYGVMDPSTVLWWMQQTSEAKEVFNPKESSPLKEVLLEFNDWISQIEKLKDRIVWGNGATFDNVILANSYRTAFGSVPWGHYGDRDVRTIVDLGRTILKFDPKRDMPFEGVKHNALDDAIHQAKYVSAIYQGLVNNLSLSEVQP